MKSLRVVALFTCTTLGFGCTQTEPEATASNAEEPEPAPEQIMVDPEAAEAATEPPKREERMKTDSKVPLRPKLDEYVSGFLRAIDDVPAERKQELERIAKWVRERTGAGEEAKLTFICTHNSRRSHLSQLWAAVAAAYYGVAPVTTYSGGTEATAFNPRAVSAVERAGFEVENPGGDNPHYEVSFAESAPVQKCFSKKYDDPSNPDEGFAAVMTCAAADKSCPTVKGASLRVAVPYEDPKVADGTPAEAERYDERCKQIATEMFYLFSRVSADARPATT